MRMDEQKVASIIEMELMVLDILELAELKDFKDGDLVSRPQVVEKLWDYLKEKNIQNPKAEALPASDYLSLSRYLSFFSFTSQTLSDI